MIHANVQPQPSRAPGLIRMPGPLVNKLLALGVPDGSERPRHDPRPGQRRAADAATGDLQRRGRAAG